MSAIRLPQRGWLFDLDGTVYLGEALIPGAADTIAALRAAGRRVAFLSNKPLYTREDYADKLTRVQKLQSRQFVESATAGDIDVIAAAAEQGLVAVNLVMIRGGRHVGDRTFFPRNVESGDEADVVTAFLTQHYVERPVPPTLVAPQAGSLQFLLKEHDSVRSGSVVARIRYGDAPPADVRSPLAGQLERQLAKDKATVLAGAEIAVLSPGQEQVWEALRALYLVGRPEDLGDVEGYAQGSTGMPDRSSNCRRRSGMGGDRSKVSSTHLQHLL